MRFHHQKIAAALLVVVGLALNQCCSASSFQSTLGQVLAQTGLKERPLSEEQLKLIKAMSQIYESDDILEEDERRILAGKPTGKEIMTLKVMFNKHLMNVLQLDRLAEQLREANEASEAGHEAPAVESAKESAEESVEAAV